MATKKKQPKKLTKQEAIAKIRARLDVLDKEIDGLEALVDACDSEEVDEAYSMIIDGVEQMGCALSFTEDQDDD